MCGTQGRLDRRLWLFNFKRTVLYLPTPSARLLTLPRPGRDVPPFPRFCFFTTSTHLAPPFNTMRRSTRSSSSPHNLPPFYRRARENKASNRLAEAGSGSRPLRRSTESWQSGEQSQKMQEDDVEIKVEDDDEDVDQLMSTEDHRDDDGRERSTTTGGTPVLHFQLQRASLAPSESRWSGSAALDGVEIAQDEPLGGAFTRSPGPALVIGPAIKAMYACREQSCELDVGDACAVKRVLNRPPRFMWFKDDPDNDDSDSDVPEGTQEENAGDGDRFMKEDDEDYLYARVVRPLFREGDTQDKSPNSIPTAAGALVHLYMR
ncbi:hypothetical protein K525DRAFT_280525, partial [Schizophyllum commune Loenen D]